MIEITCAKFTACAIPKRCKNVGYCCARFEDDGETFSVDPSAVASSSPVRTVTRKEIVPGTYGPDEKLNVETGTDEASVFIDLDDGWYKAAEIREFARLLNEIADAMEDQP